MTGSRSDLPTAWVDPDDAPDLSTPEWQAKFDAADVYEGDRLVRRGRPKLDKPKRLVTLRLDQDVIDRLRGSGPGWQGRVNETLKALVGL